MGAPDAPDSDKTAGKQGDLSRLYVVRTEREKVLEAILQVAAAKGYEATTVEDIVEAAGVSGDTFSEMFESKQACFLEAYDAAIDVLVARMSEAFEAADAPWPDRITAALRALVELLAAESDIARIAMVEVTALGDDARVRYRAAFDRFIPFLESGRDYSGQGDALPPDTASFAIGGATSRVFDEVRAGHGAEIKRVLPDLVFAVLMPYLGSEAAENEMRRVAGGIGS